MDDEFKWKLAINSSYAFHTVGSVGAYKPQDGYVEAVAG